MSRSSSVKRRSRRGAEAPRTAGRILVLLCVSASLCAGISAAPLQYGFGKPASPKEIAGWDIDVRPDGTGLPRGRGSVADGRGIYDAKCASCHGTFGESNSHLQIAGGVGTLGTDQPVRSTGSKLNYATTLWDYINRAMPFDAAQTLAPDEVYALTAYVLNLNDILPADAVLDQDSLPKVKLPNRDGFTTDHGFMRRDGKPDTRNTACMTNCAAEVRLSSEMPDHARDQHGNIAEQVRGPRRDGEERTGQGRGFREAWPRPRRGDGAPRRRRQAGGARLSRDRGQVRGRRRRRGAPRREGEGGRDRGPGRRAHARAAAVEGPRRQRRCSGFSAGRNRHTMHDRRAVRIPRPALE
jgi:mono/diheme cytochrome c family protein